MDDTLYVSQKEWDEIERAFSWIAPEGSLTCPLDADGLGTEWNWVHLKTADQIADAMYHIPNFPLRQIAENGGADYFVALYANHDQPFFMAALIDRIVCHMTLQHNHEPSNLVYFMEHALIKQRRFLEANVGHFYKEIRAVH